MCTCLQETGHHHALAPGPQPTGSEPSVHMQQDLDGALSASQPIFQEEIAGLMLSAQQASDEQLRQLRSDFSYQLKSTQDQTQLIRQQNIQELQKQHEMQQAALADLASRLASQQAAAANLTAQQQALGRSQVDARTLLNNSISQLKNEIELGVNKQKLNQQSELEAVMRKLSSHFEASMTVSGEQQQQLDSSMEALRSKQLQNQEAAAEAIAALSSQQEELQRLPQQLQDAEQQLAQLHHSVSASISTAISSAEQRQHHHMQRELQELQAKQLQQQKKTEEAIKSLQLQQAGPQQLREGEERLAELSDSMQAAIRAAVSETEQRLLTPDRVDALQVEQQEQLDAAMQSLSALERQQADFQLLPQRFDKIQRQFERLNESIATSIDSGIVAAEGRQQNGMRDAFADLQAQQQQQWTAALDAIADLQSQQQSLQKLPEQVDESQQQLTGIKKSLEEFVSSSVAGAEQRQQAHVDSKVLQIQAVQQEHQQAAEEAMLALQSNQLSFDQIPGLVHEVQRQLAKLHVSTHEAIHAAISASESRSDEQVQDLQAKQSHQQKELEEALATLQSQQTHVQQLPQQLQEAQQQLSKLRDLMRASIDASISALEARQAEQMQQWQAMQEHKQASADHAISDLRNHQTGLDQLPEQLQDTQQHLEKLEERINASITSAISASEAHQQKQMQELLQLPDQLQQAQERLNTVQDTMGASFEAAIKAAEGRQLESLQGLLAEQQEQQQATNDSIISLQDEQANLRSLSQQLNEVQQQVAKMHLDMGGFIRSAVADAEGTYRQQLDDLQKQQQLHVQAAEQARATMQSQQSELEHLPQQLREVQQQLAEVKGSMKSSMQATIAAASERQRQQTKSDLDSLDSKQQQQSAAAAEAIAMLKSQQAALQQLPQQMEEAQAQLAKLEDSMNAAMLAAVSAAEDRQQSQILSILGKQQEQLRASEEASAALQSQQAILVQLQEAQAELKNSLNVSVGTAVAAAEERQQQHTAHQMQGMQAQHQHELDATRESITALQRQQAELLQVPQQLQEAQQHLNNLSQSIDAAISSAVTASEGRQTQQMDRLQIQQQRQRLAADQAIAAVATQQSELQQLPQQLMETQQALAHLNSSMGQSITSAITAAEERQKQQMHDLAKDLQAKQGQAAQAAQDNSNELQSQQASLQQLSQQLHDAQTRFDQVQDSTNVSIEAALSAAEERQQHHVQSLLADLQAKQQRQLDSALSKVQALQTEQSDLTAVYQQLEGVHQQVSSLQAQQSGLQQEPRFTKQLSSLQAAVEQLQDDRSGQPGPDQAALKISMEALQVTARAEALDCTYGRNTSLGFLFVVISDRSAPELMHEHSITVPSPIVPARL